MLELSCENATVGSNGLMADLSLQSADNLTITSDRIQDMTILQYFLQTILVSNPAICSRYFNKEWRLYLSNSCPPPPPTKEKKISFIVTSYNWMNYWVFLYDFFFVTDTLISFPHLFWKTKRKFPRTFRSSFDSRLRITSTNNHKCPKYVTQQLFIYTQRNTFKILLNQT